MSITIDTIILQKKMKAHFQLIANFTHADDEIIGWMSLANNTFGIVERAFRKAQAEHLTLKAFYKVVIKDFLAQDIFPMCAERIIATYPELYDTAISFVLPSNCLKKGVQNNNNTPYLDAGNIKIPFEEKWNFTLNIGAFSRLQHNYVTEQLVSKLNSVQYELTGSVKLVTGIECRTLSTGFYTFYYGKGWLIVEFNR